MSHQCTYGDLDHHDDFLSVDHTPSLSEKKEEIINEKGLPTYWGNRRHKVYHDRNCYCVSQIDAHNLVGLDETCIDEDDRLYRACGHCLGKNFNQMMRELVEKRGGDE